MAETIKGINVVIGAETTGLSAALSDVTKNSKNIQGELKQVEKLLKLDPGNTELLAQKQNLLGDAIAASTQKLNTLRTAQQQVNEQFARGDISEGQYRAFQREIAAAEQELKRFEDRARNTGTAVNNLGNDLQATGDKMKSAGEKMSIGLTAPIVAGGAVIVKGALDAEAAQGKLQAQLGATAEEAELLGAAAKEAWKSGFGENIDAANEAVKDVKLNMKGVSDESLPAVATGAMAIADIFDSDVKGTTAAAGVAMKAFKMEGQDALDLITTGFQKGGDYSGELLDTIREYSPQFADMGMTADQMLGTLISGAQAGAWNMDKVGDAVKEFNIRAQDGSKTTAEGFAAIGLDAQKMGADIAAGGEKGQQAFVATVAGLAAMKDPVAQNAAGVALFGTQWEDVRADVIIAMADGMNSLGEFKGATAEATKAMQDNNPGLAMTAAMRELQDAFAPALTPIIEMINNSVIPAVKSMAEWFTGLSPTSQTVILAIAGIAAAIGPLLLILGPIVSVIGSIVGALGALSAAMAGGAAGIAILTTAFPALGTAFAVITGPIGIAVAAIIGLTTVGVLLYKNWDVIKAKAIEIWAAIKQTFESNIQALGAGWEALKVGLKGVGEFFTQTWEGIKTKTAEIWGGIKQFLIDWWPLLLGLLTGPVGLVIGLVIQNWDTVRIKTIEIWDGIKAFFEEWWKKLTDWIGAWDIWLYVKNMWETLKTNTVEVWEALKKSLEIWWNSFTGWLGTWNPWNFIQQRWDNLKANTIGVFTTLKIEIESWWSSFISWLSTWNPWAAVQHIWNNWKSNTIGVWQDLKQNAVTWGHNIIQGMADGITERLYAARDAALGVAEAVKDKVKSVLGIQSPSTVMNGFGQNISQGLANGITDKSSEVTTAMSNIVTSVNGQISTITSGFTAMKNTLETPVVVAAPIYTSSTFSSYGGGGGGVSAADIGWDTFDSMVANGSSGSGSSGGISVVDAGGWDAFDAMIANDMGFAEGGIATKAIMGVFGEAGHEALLPLASLQPMMTNALLGAISVLGNSVSNTQSSSVLYLQVENRGTIVGRNGMDEFAKTVSKQISKDFGLTTGGVW